MVRVIVRRRILLEKWGGVGDSTKNERVILFSYLAWW